MREEAAVREREAALAAEAEASGLEVTANRLESVLADVRAGAEQRDAGAAAERRTLEAALEAARQDATAARQEAAEAARREHDASDGLQALRSELELAQRALEARDAELARSADRRARALARPRTAAGVTGEHPVLDPGGEAPDPDPTQDELDPTEIAAAGPGPTEAARRRARPPDRAGRTAAPSARPHRCHRGRAWPHRGRADVRDACPTPPRSNPYLADPDEGDPVPDDDTLDLPDGDLVPDDEEPDTTMAHEPAPPSDPELPEDTGPIPLRRISERRYAPGTDRDEPLGGEDAADQRRGAPPDLRPLAALGRGPRPARGPHPPDGRHRRPGHRGVPRPRGDPRVRVLAPRRNAGRSAG